ncbi:MAG: M1 family aminopeptidase [Spirochaetota bacterium]|nr:M1 family aminopeptidase [Spirochaetota bacterium]
MIHRKLFSHILLLISLIIVQSCHEDKGALIDGQNPYPEKIHYNISLNYSPQKKEIHGVTHIKIPVTKKQNFIINLKSSLNMKQIKVNNRKLSFIKDKKRVTHLQNYAIQIPDGVTQPYLLSIEYSGHFQTEKNLRSQGGKDKTDSILVESQTGWHPSISWPLAVYRIQIRLPEAYHAVTEGKLRLETLKGAVREVVYSIDKPVPGANLIIGKYQVNSTRFRGLLLRTYFSKMNESLSDSYIEHSKRYIDLYEKMIGKYPFSKFFVVETNQPVGYGMSSFTTIGGGVIRLPFIVRTSLGHEVLHNWWGNSVYVSESGGNWCEGLTSYLADHYYLEQRGSIEVTRYRRNVIKTFSHHVKENTGFPLEKFTHRYDKMSSSIGYGKAMMLFHQLRLLLGDKLFFSGLKYLYQTWKFRYLSWSDIERHFETLYQKDLSWFFKQWLRRKGAPTLRLGKVTYSENSGNLVLNLIQEGAKYRLLVPILIETGNGTIRKRIVLSKQKQSFAIPVKSRPVKVIIDPDYDIFRRILPGEVSPSLSQVFGDSSEKILLSDRITAFTKRLAGENRAVNLDLSHWQKSLQSPKTVILWGKQKDKSLYSAFIKPKTVEITPVSFSVDAVKYTDSEMTFVAVLRSAKSLKPCLIIHSLGKAPPARLLKRLRHYQSDSYLILKGDKVIKRGEFPQEGHPLHYQF